MLMTHFIWQTVLKPLSVTDAKNGAITPSLIPTMEAGHYSVFKWVRLTWRGITNSSKRLGALLVLYLGILWMSVLGGWGGGVGGEVLCFCNYVTRHD